MSDGATTASSLRPAVRRRRSPDLASWLPARWSTVLTVYLASRVFSLVLLAVVWEVAHLAGFEFRTPGAGLSLLDFTTSWDADRYRTIALQGYPSVLPTDAAGNVLPNEWAFLPVFPTLCHLLMVATGLPFSGAALLLSTAFGAGAALVLYRLVDSAVGHRGAIWAVLLLCFGPLGFLFSVGYAEGLMLFLLFGGVLAMQQRRYGLVLACGVVAAFTRPGALALALALAVHLVVRWRTEGRADPSSSSGPSSSGPSSGSSWPWQVLPRRDLVQIVTAGAAIAAAGLAWPVVAHLATGQHDAYLQTEMAWWVDYVGRPAFVPLTPWFLLAGRWLGIGGIALVLALLVLAAVWFTRRSTLRLGHETVAFTASFALYLVAVFLPQQSLFRLLLPLTPLLGAPAVSERPVVRRTLLVGGIALQPVAVVLLWVYVAP
ncbi:hypothetical protein ES689_00670 [Frigoribacterium sp. ACAM 257]|uniref:hypothetical protein n=1 Tax=Frigoribacterium sp. ACAM 257 TaxID=2508998 RepID=UPI0011BA4170|nr:hypothetical protein [Frigoribacterium sp. ACAM 257]TWX40045.1 hypothetical protein ES689_00670 [Frigoribacterium sp. ACAM 257]